MLKKYLALTKFKYGSYLLSYIIKDNHKEQMVKTLDNIWNERLENKKTYDEFTLIVVVIDKIIKLKRIKLKE